MVILLIKKKNIFQRLQNICFDLIPDVNNNDDEADILFKPSIIHERYGRITAKDVKDGKLQSNVWSVQRVGPSDG